MSGFFRIENLAGLLLVVAIHGVLIYAAMRHRLIPLSVEAMPLMVNLINPPPKKEEPLPPEPPKPKPTKVKLVKPQPVSAPPQPVLVSNAPVTSPAEPVAPPPPLTPVPIVEAPPAPPAPDPVVEAPPPSPAPVILASDLAVACPQRSAPEYPATSRRLNEQGRVVLRVELDETGRVVSARVKESSGFKRLDEAGLTVVKTWHCNAPVRDGQAVKAMALQPFNFVLEGRK